MTDVVIPDDEPVDEPLPDEVVEAPEEEAPPEEAKDDPDEGYDGETQDEPEADPEGEEEKPEDKPRRKPSRTQRKIANLQSQLEEMRGLLAQKVEPKVEAPQKPPKPEDFDDYGDFQEALIAHKVAEQIGKERAKFDEERRATRHAETARTMAQKQASLHDEGGAKYEDWEEVFDNTVPVSPAMAEAILESETGHEVAYYLGKHRDEAKRIAGMNPIAAAREIGRLEAKLTTTPAKKTTNAPSPVKSLGGTAGSKRDPSKMSFDEYAAARKAGKLK